MKTLISKICLLVLIAVVIGCDDNERPIDTFFDNTTRGTVLRTIDDQTSLEFNVGVENLVTIGAEVIDQRGQDFEKVDVFLSFIDNNPEDGDNSKDEVLAVSIPKADFDQSGEYPVLDLNFNTEDINSTLGLTSEDYTGGDRFDVRLALVMNDGRVFSSNNVNNVVSGGAFFRSPFLYAINVTCFVPQDYFVGEYLMERISDQESPFGDSFTQEGEVVTITRNGADRVFEFTYFPGGFDFNQQMVLSLICNEIFVNGGAVSGTLGCGDGSIGQGTPEVPSTYDLENDTEIIIDILDFEPDAGCGTGSYPVTLRFTKQTGN
ncbi:hypothetical protein [Psychroflexus tropicus]|uniref:hypothetical protein n=1 Tax=Psychroflexus tropicus TaxID=197345 RepID=UPI0003632A67|nr:hypothetical protein [Psychroflexus tropicus]